MELCKCPKGLYNIEELKILNGTSSDYATSTELVISYSPVHSSALSSDFSVLSSLKLSNMLTDKLVPTN